MKRKLIYGLVLSLVLVIVYSFTLTRPGAKAATVKDNPKQQFACGTVVQSITSKTYNYAANTVTVVFAITGGAASTYNCGGNYFCATGSSFTVNSTTTTVTFPLGPGGCGGNSRITPICADGTQGTPLVFSF